MKNKILLTLVASFTIFILNAQTKIGVDIDGEAAGDFSGFSVSMPDQVTMGIGARENDGNGSNSGHARIYSWNGTAWAQKGVDLDGEAVDDLSGYSVSMPDASTIAIGAPGNDDNGADAGHVRVYTWNGSAWVQKGIDIDGEFAGDAFGFVLSMPDANTLGVGALGNDGTGVDAGHARVYTWNGGAWVQKGMDIDGEAAGDQSGRSVSMPDPNTIAIGAFLNDGIGVDGGHVRVYSWISGAWVQKGIDVDGEAAGDESGVAVSMPDANTVAIGAWSNDGNGVSAGQARIYSWVSGAWVQKGADIDGEGVADESGRVVSMPDANTIAVGAFKNDGTAADAGHARVYQWTGSAWLQTSQDIDGESLLDRSGSVSMPTPDYVAVGAFRNDGGGQEAGHVRVYSLCTPGTSTDVVVDCNPITWINGNTYSSSNNSATHILVGGAANGCDSIITLNYTRSPAIPSTNTVAACDTFTWIDGITYTSSNNTATFTFVGGASNGCDSIVALDLSINSPNVNTSITGITITAAQSGATTYYWLNCDNGFFRVPGANSQIFAASANGNYAVEITINGCVDTSACVSMVNVGFTEAELNNGLNIYPNPTNDMVTFERTIGLETNLSYSIVNIQGEQIIDGSFARGEKAITLNLEELSSGIYFLKITGEEIFKVFPVTKH